MTNTKQQTNAHDEGHNRWSQRVRKKKSVADFEKIHSRVLNSSNCWLSSNRYGMTNLTIHKLYSTVSCMFICTVPVTVWDAMYFRLRIPFPSRFDTLRLLHNTLNIPQLLLEFCNSANLSPVHAATTEAMSSGVTSSRSMREPSDSEARSMSSTASSSCSSFCVARRGHSGDIGTRARPNGGSGQGSNMAT